MTRRGTPGESPGVGAASAATLILLLASCATPPKADPAPDPPPQATAAPADAPAPRKVSPYAPAQEDPSKRGNYTAGGLYAPGVRDSAPAELPRVDLIPEPLVVAEPRSRYGNRSPYSVLGKAYRVLDSAEGYVEQGIASYYGQKFHGRRTSSLEVYDMYAFSAAHKTLPLPSYARVTNLENGESVVVRVNDRGPFHEGRIIDLSYAAAVKLGIHRSGTARVEVRALMPNPPDPDASAATVVAAPAEPAPPTAMDALVAALPETPDAPAAPPASAQPTATVVLQVASFSTRLNAERALERLRAAGIDGAQVLGAVADGQPVWRVRVGPVADAAAADLAARVAGLGFGAPQRLRE